MSATQPDVLAPARSGPATVAGLAYGRVARALHWSMALLFLIIVPIGLYCASLRGLPGRALEREQWLFVHKSLGLLVLALALVRLAWRLTHRPPPLPATLPAHERVGAKLVHVGLYVLLFAAPLSGLLLSQGAGQPVTFFGLIDLPQLVPIDRSVPAPQRPEVQAGVLLHKVVFKYALWGLIALHLVGVAKHLWIDRDPSVWRRMWGGRG